MDIWELQKQTAIWQTNNFSEAKAHQPLLGIIEEVGELSHAHLKQEQGIRNSNTEDKEDAVGDIIIFLCHYCTMNNIDMDNAVVSTWEKVKQRDWKKYPKNGVTE